MKFLLDESVDARLAPFLQLLGHDATVVGRDYPASIPDREVLAHAYSEGRVLITDDRDFGELVFRQRQPHAGVLYFRLPPVPVAVKLVRLAQVLTGYPNDLDRYLVITQHRVRIRANPAET